MLGPLPVTLQSLTLPLLGAGRHVWCFQQRSPEPGPDQDADPEGADGFPRKRSTQVLSPDPSSEMSRPDHLGEAKQGNPSPYRGRHVSGHTERGAQYSPSRIPLIFSQNLAAACDLRSFEQAASELQGWMQGKTTLLEEEFRVHSLSSAPPLLQQQQQQQHRCLQVKALPKADHLSLTPPGIRQKTCVPQSLIRDGGQWSHLGPAPEPLLQGHSCLAQGTWTRF